MIFEKKSGLENFGRYGVRTKDRDDLSDCTDRSATVDNGVGGRSWLLMGFVSLLMIEC